MISKANLILVLILIAGIAAWMPYVLAIGPGEKHAQEVSAQEILSEINDGHPVDYDGIVLVGDLDLSSLQGRVPVAIKIANSRIKGKITAKEIVFDGRADFSNTTFEKEACFLDSSFRDRAYFDGARFYGPCNFSLAELYNTGDFDGAQFSGPADFNYATFDRVASFARARFLGESTFYLVGFNGIYADFADAEFHQNVSFESSKFIAYASFERCRFDKAADFHMTQFGDSLALNDAHFGGPANFVRSQLYKEAWFYNDVFFGPSDFKNARFDGPSYFGNCRFREMAGFANSNFDAPSNFSHSQFDADFDLNGTRINNLIMNNASFNSSSRIFMQGSSISQMMVRWADLKDHIYFNPSAYLALINNYRGLGRGSDANDCYYDYRSISRSNKEIGLSKFLDTVAWLSCGYGVRPHYALILGLCIIIIFALTLWRGCGHEDLKSIKGWPSIATALYYSAIAFTANAKGYQWSGRYKYPGHDRGHTRMARHGPIPDDPGKDNDWIKTYSSGRDICFIRNSYKLMEGLIHDYHFGHYNGSPNRISVRISGAHDTKYGLDWGYKETWQSYLADPLHLHFHF